MSELVIRNLHVSIEGKEILKGLDLTVRQGEVHAIMGPNGTGKSTLAYALMGHPSYEVTEGEVIYKGKIFSSWSRMSALAWAFSWHFSTRLQFRV
jgi:Fe-S cluster assembly ATP-binding protein